MAKYSTIAKTLIEFKAIKINQVERDLNSRAEALAGLASDLKEKLDGPS